MISIERQLRTRLVISLLVLLLAVALVTDIGVRQFTREFIATRLQHDADALIKSLYLAEDGGWKLDPEHLPPIYQRVLSGHYFQVRTPEQRLRSRSLWDRSVEMSPLAPGVGQILDRHEGDEHWLIWQQGVQLQGQALTLWVAEDIAPFEAQWRRYSLALYGLMVMVVALMILWQRLLLRRGFRRVADIGTAIRHLQQGKIETLAGEVPEEIRPLTVEINFLLQRLEQRIVRTRTAIGNLAHEIKPQLQQIRLLARQLPPEGQAQLEPLLERVTNLIERELKRARIAGSPQPGCRFNPRQELPHLLTLFQRIYPRVQIELQGLEDREYPLDRDDMLELLGNLIDNACKFGATAVRVQLNDSERHLSLSVRDDGEGVDQASRQRLLERGARLDESVDGHGLGLSICRMIVESYRGELRFEDGLAGPSQGLGVRALLPLTRATDAEEPGV